MKRSILPVITVSLLLLSSCEYKTQSKNIVCLIDFSRSVSEQTFNFYNKSISEQVFLNLGNYDELSIYPVDKASSYQNSLIFNESLIGKENEFADPDDGVFVLDTIDFKKKLYLNSKKIELEKSLRMVYTVRHKKGGFGEETDLLGALDNLDGLSKRTPSSNSGLKEYIKDGITFEYRNILIIFSDMINQTSEFDFATWKTVESEAVIECLDKLIAQQRIPKDLTGWEIFIIGATVHDDNKNEFNNIRDFWYKYFTRRGANIIDYQYDNTKSILEALISS
jgi:hypothetical protein